MEEQVERAPAIRLAELPAELPLSTWQEREMLRPAAEQRPEQVIIDVELDHLPQQHAGRNKRR